MDFDLFWVRPVLVDPSGRDEADENVQFYGAWATFRPTAGQYIDIYYL
jgi:hypothetical protein